METLPPVLLGVRLFVPFLVVLALRSPLANRFIVSQPRIDQPRKQFFLDFSLCIAVGAVVVTYNTLAHGFPAPSGISLMLGCTVVGFFLSMDMSLARERTAIHETLAEESLLSPPRCGHY